MASITCGNCKSTHGSAAEVRACYRPTTARPAKTTPMWAKAKMNTNWSDPDSGRGEFPARRTEKMITRPQSDYIWDLTNEIAKLSGLPEIESTKDEFFQSMSEVTCKGASKVLDVLKDKAFELSSKKARTTPAGAPEVADGRYAIEQDGIIKFYKVDSPTEGKWAGRTFVKIQASEELHPIRNPAARKAILAEIAKDPKGAMLRYGQELGHCGHCGRTLTNDLSRELGIGPVCREKMGW